MVVKLSSIRMGNEPNTQSLRSLKDMKSAAQQSLNQN